MFLSNFNYSILGQNSSERIVFLHGMMAFAGNWRKIANRLEDEYQCLIFDQRGHGRSFKPETGYSPDIFAEDLNLITQELGWDRFHLVGHSMGGRNAMVFAHKHPEKVKTLTIEDIGPESDMRSILYYKEMLEQVPTPFHSREEIKNYFTQQFEKNFKAKEPISVLSTFLQANLEEKTDPTGLATYDWRFSKNAVYEMIRDGSVQDRWLEVSNFKMPVLLVRGEKSHLLSHETFEKMCAVNSNIHGVEIADAGHWVHYEKYEEFTEVLRDFLRDSNDS